MSWGHITTWRLVLIASVGLCTACGTSRPAAAPSNAPAASTSAASRLHSASASVTELEQMARQYADAKAVRDFGRIWDMLASQSKRLTMLVSKKPAEVDDTRAKSQGFDSAAHVKSLDDRSYFQARRQHMAAEGQYAYSDGVTATEVHVGKPVYVPISGRRLFVYPATIVLSDGSSDLVGVTENLGQYYIVEP